MSKSESRQNFETLSAADVADLLFVSEKTVRNWMNKNDLPSVDSGRGRVLQWKAVLEWYVTYRQKEGGNSGNALVKTPTFEVPALPPEYMEAALRRKTVAEADLKELQLAKERGQVASIEDVKRNIAAVAQAIQQKILAIPSRLTPRLVSIDDRNVVNSILEGEAHQLCSELATVGSRGGI